MAPLSSANFWFYANTKKIEIATDKETDIGSAPHA